MNDSLRCEPQGPPATSLRILGARPQGFSVEIRLLDGTVRKAWVPRSLVDDARLRLHENRDMVALIGDQGSLGSAGVQTLALLCAQPQASFVPFTEVAWSFEPGGASSDDDMTELPTERYLSEDSLPGEFAWDSATPVPVAAPTLSPDPPWSWEWMIPGIGIGALAMLAVVLWIGTP